MAASWGPVMLRKAGHNMGKISPLQDVFMAALLMGLHDGAATPPHDCLPTRLDKRARCSEKPDRDSAAGPSETAGPGPVCRRNGLEPCPVASPQDRPGARHPRGGRYPGCQ